MTNPAPVPASRVTELLKSIEFIDSDGWRTCPVCETTEAHSQDCELSEVLEACQSARVIIDPPQPGRERRLKHYLDQLYQDHETGTHDAIKAFWEDIHSASPELTEDRGFAGCIVQRGKDAKLAENTALRSTVLQRDAREWWEMGCFAVADRIREGK